MIRKLSNDIVKRKRGWLKTFVPPSLDGIGGLIGLQKFGQDDLTRLSVPARVLLNGKKFFAAKVAALYIGARGLKTTSYCGTGDRKDGKGQFLKFGWML
jgi:hypothetical protein